jgi:UDP-N-acetylmuramoyl-L-alanyl-D-glutamate--2,6-diaminopimelate ligase
MGEISAKLAEYTIITSDNPRYEDPMEIISEIEKGVRSVSKKYVAIEDRKDAIFYALNMLIDGDLLLIAGKGCEDYQEILGIKKPYNDKDIVEEYFG